MSLVKERAFPSAWAGRLGVGPVHNSVLKFDQGSQMDSECSFYDSPSLFPSRPVALPDELRGALLLPSECPSDDISHLGSSPEVCELFEQVPTNPACGLCGAINFFDNTW